MNRAEMSRSTCWRGIYYQVIVSNQRARDSLLLLLLPAVSCMRKTFSSDHAPPVLQFIFPDVQACARLLALVRSVPVLFTALHVQKRA